MKLDNKEIDALRKLLSLNQNQKDPILKNIYNKIDSKLDSFSMYIDGAADLHSKTSGIGGVIYKDSEEIFTFSEYVHDSTNNEAEYGALIRKAGALG